MPVDGAWLTRTVRTSFAPRPPARLGVAVSGGGDSVALLVLLDDWRRDGGPELAVVTVDHGLRAEAAEEAAGVADLCARLGVPHQTLQWRWDGRGNLSDAGRRGRYGLIGAWALGLGIGCVALGHTADDQAETFLMRLARGSGVDGLSGMAARRKAEGVAWVRPVLGLRREDLRAFLRARGVGWAEDPTNEDDAYDRVKARRALEVLGGLGIDHDRIADTVFRLSLASTALRQVAEVFARQNVLIDRGDVLIARHPLAHASYETGLRVLSAAIRWVAGGDYRPRLLATQEALADAVSRRTHTLGGCLISGDKTHVRVTREHQAVRDLSCPTDRIWDSRWRLTGPHAAGLAIRALGESGLRGCPDWRATGLPRRSLLASPAVWAGQRLVAAPLAGNANGWVAEPAKDPEDFFASLIVH